MFMYQHSSTALLYQQYIGCKQTILFEKFMMQIWFFYNQYLSSQQTASLKLLDISSQFFLVKDSAINVDIMIHTVQKSWPCQNTVETFDLCVREVLNRVLAFVLV